MHLGVYRAALHLRRVAALTGARAPLVSVYSAANMTSDTSIVSIRRYHTSTVNAYGIGMSTLRTARACHWPAYMYMTLYTTVSLGFQQSARFKGSNVGGLVHVTHAVNRRQCRICPWQATGSSVS